MSVLPAAAIGEASWTKMLTPRGLPLVPRNLGVAVLIAYRTIVSPLYGDVCKYYPSCSAFGLHAVQQHGLVRGSARTLARIARCHPWASGGVDDVTLPSRFQYDLTRHGFVVPRPQAETN